MSFADYAFANEFDTLLSYFETASWIMAAGLFAIGYLIWRHHKKNFEKSEQKPKAA